MGNSGPLYEANRPNLFLLLPRRVASASASSSSVLDDEAASDMSELFASNLEQLLVESKDAELLGTLLTSADESLLIGVFFGDVLAFSSLPILFQDYPSAIPPCVFQRKFTTEFKNALLVFSCCQYGFTLESLALDEQKFEGILNQVFSNWSYKHDWEEVSNAQLEKLKRGRNNSYESMMRFIPIFMYGTRKKALLPAVQLSVQRPCIVF